MINTDTPIIDADQGKSKDPVGNPESQKPGPVLQGCCSRYLTSVNVKDWKKQFMVIYCALMETSLIVSFYMMFCSSTNTSNMFKYLLVWALVDNIFNYVVIILVKCTTKNLKSTGLYVLFTWPLVSEFGKSATIATAMYFAFSGISAPTSKWILAPYLGSIGLNVICLIYFIILICKAANYMVDHVVEDPWKAVQEQEKQMSLHSMSGGSYTYFSHELRSFWSLQLLLIIIAVFCVQSDFNWVLYMIPTQIACACACLYLLVVIWRFLTLLVEKCKGEKSPGRPNFQKHGFWCHPLVRNLYVDIFETLSGQFLMLAIIFGSDHMNWVSGNLAYLPADPKDFTDDKFGQAKTFMLCYIVFVAMKWFQMIFVVDRVEHMSFAGVLGELSDERQDPSQSLFFNPHPDHTKGNHVDALVGNHLQVEVILNIGLDTDAEPLL